jgi:NitT/TauT family transport system substrate-binding protein
VDAGLPSENTITQKVGLAMKLAVPDMISNSYFPAIATIELGFFRREGLDVELELIFPVDKAYAALRDGAVELVGGSAHSALAAFPQWQGVKLLCAQAQGMYWFLVMHRDFGARRGDIGSVKGRRIGAAPWVEMGLRRLLIEAGIDPARDGVSIAPVPGAQGAGVNFGVTAAQALADRKIDGFWANGMGAEVAVRRGVGSIVLDIRRGDGPKPCFNYTMASVATSDRLIEAAPAMAAAAIRAVAKTHAALKNDLTLATTVGRKLFPPMEAELIAELVRRDLPYYDIAISDSFVAGMNAFARDLGILQGDVPYAQIVAPQLRLSFPPPLAAKG